MLKRTRQTAVIAALHGVTRPENQRMVNLLDIHIEIITPELEAALLDDDDGAHGIRAMETFAIAEKSGIEPPD